MRSIADPPPRSAAARFDPAFGQRFLLIVDTAALFDREPPTAPDGDGVDHLARLARFQQFCENEAVVPVYLVDWQVARSSRAAEILRGPLAAGRAEIGMRLHPRADAPIDEELVAHGSFSGNLRDEIERNFEIAPVICRAGSHGVPYSPAAIAECGVAVDCSVRARFDYSAQGGANFRWHPLVPYWLDDARRLLELPLTTVFWGVLRQQGEWLYPAMVRIPRLRRLLARASLLERIPLAPEGVTVDQAIHGIDIALDDGLPLLVFSSCGAALLSGHRLHGHDEGSLDPLYDWWRRVFAYLELRGVPATTVAGVMHAVQR